MQMFVLLTRLVGEETSPSFSMKVKEGEVVHKIREYCPNVKWIKDYALLGPWDYLDIFKAPDMETALKVSALVRYYGSAHTEIWPIVEWEAFEETMNKLSEIMEKG